MTILDTIRSSFVPIHREGWRFIAIFAAISALFFVFGLDVLGWVGVVLTAWCAYFFRDPPRTTPLGSGLIISPADGRVSAIERLVPPPELDLPREPMIRVSIFMNVFDVHVNRSPVGARIRKIVYVPGAFLNAELDKASLENERQAFTLTLDDGRLLGVVQIAGLVARRIVRFVDEGAIVHAGQRIGLIRFGSRLDVYLPPGLEPLVCIGQRAVAGETVLADVTSVRTACVGRTT